MELIYITGNHGKFLTAQHELEGTGITVVQNKMDLIEIQADLVEEIATHKAFQAGRKLSKVVMVQDSGMSVSGLSGFPGPYAKYIDTTVGPEGLLALVNALSPDKREASFDSVYAIYNPKADEVKTFLSHYEGTIGGVVSEAASAAAWSKIEKVFIPKGADKPLAQMTEAEMRESSRVARTTDAWPEIQAYLKTLGI